MLRPFAPSATNDALTPKARTIRKGASRTGRSLVGAMVGVLKDTSDASDLGGHHTLLAVCPTSKAVTRAALSAADEAGCPMLYAATLNQVDRDGGYTGWTPASFASFVAEEAARQNVDVPIVLGLDHGGPWKKDRHAQDDLPYQETLAEVKMSLRACIDAGYELLHLDPTEDRRLGPGQPVPTETIAERTLELLGFSETERRDAGRGPIAYEVGTEEVGGGLQSGERFCSFLRHLSDGLAQQDLPTPQFVVGDVGTKLDTKHFNAVRARRLTREATQQIGALLKGHYTDAVADLAQYPLSGMGGANVGPGLAAAEWDALQDLVALERHLNQKSGFERALRSAVVESGRWTKWLRLEEEGLSFDALPDARRRWLVETGSRYVWTDDRVEAARETLYQNVRRYRDAEAFVHWRVKTAILQYVHAFNLVGFTDVLQQTLGTDR